MLSHSFIGLFRIATANDASFTELDFPWGTASPPSKPVGESFSLSNTSLKNSSLDVIFPSSYNFPTRCLITSSFLFKSRPIEISFSFVRLLKFISIPPIHIQQIRFA